MFVLLLRACVQLRSHCLPVFIEGKNMTAQHTGRHVGPFRLSLLAAIGIRRTSRLRYLLEPSNHNHKKTRFNQQNYIRRCVSILKLCYLLS
ncbi:hypothetical protein AHAS_Ahas17G0309800 [Arachis hypogaea]